LIWPQQGKVFLPGLVVRAIAQNLSNDRRGVKHVVAMGNNPGTLGSVVSVGIAGLNTRIHLHNHLESCLKKARNHCGYQRNPALAGIALSRNPNNHGAFSVVRNSNLEEARETPSGRRHRRSQFSGIGETGLSIEHLGKRRVSDVSHGSLPSLSSEA
jgi:hypothetical protein